MKIQANLSEDGVAFEIWKASVFFKFGWPDQVLRCTVMVLTHLCQHLSAERC